MRYSDEELREEISSAQRSLDSNPNDVDALQRLGKAYIDLGLVDEARASYERAVAVDPRDPWSRLYLGNLHYYVKAYGEALRAFSLARDLAPDLGQPYKCLGDVFNRLKDPVHAEAMYRKACEVDPDDAAARRALAGWLEKQNDA